MDNTLAKRLPRHDSTIDFLRAVLIILVILIHIVNFGDKYPEVKYSILSFIMPAFLVVTGFLVNVRKSVPQFVLYLLRILLPYLIMVTGFMLLSLYLPVNDRVERLNLPTLYRVYCVTSIGPYWFLHTMMVCGTLYFAADRLAARFGREALLAVFAAMLIAVAFLTPYLNLSAAAYYFTGVLIRMFVGDFPRVCRFGWWALLPFALLVPVEKFHDWGTLPVMVCVFCFFSFVSALAARCSGRLLAFMRFLGRNTFPVYIFHPVFTMAMKFALPAFGFDPTGLLHTVATVAVSLAGSIAVGVAMDRLRLSYVFCRRRIMR